MVRKGKYTKRARPVTRKHRAQIIRLTGLSCLKRRIPESLRRQPGRFAKYFGEMALARVPDLRADLGDRQVGFGQQSSSFFDPQRSQIRMRRRAGDLFKQSRKMKCAQVSRPGDFGEAQFSAA